MQTSRKHSLSRGFTLIELMIVVAIVAILAAVAINSYSKYAMRSRRSDAYAALSKDQGMMERCYALTFSFANAQTGSNNCAAVATVSPSGYYTITPAASSSTYTLTATPASGSVQLKDTTCASFTLDNTNSKTAKDSAGNDQSAACWLQ